MKKGFTLIEMIATVVILSVVSIVIVLGIKTVREKENEKKWNNTVSRITSAADVYLEKNKTLKEEIYNTGVVKYISINEITNAGLLDENELIDPRDETPVLEKKEDSYVKVKVYLNNNDSLEIEYPSKTSKYIIFDSKTIYAYLGETIDCLKGINVYNESNTKVSTNVINSIKVKNSKYKVVNNKVTFEEMGEYELVYSIGENTYSRKVKVLKVEDAFYTAVGEFDHLIQATGTYRITVSGAQGTGGGGKGGTVVGEIKLTKNSLLKLVVGGQEAKYGGGKGQNNGGDSSRVIYNDATILLGAGGGGGANGTAGGTGTGVGGASQGSGAGSAGTNGGGGGSSYNHSYSCNCGTCGGECNGWRAEKYDCSTCGGGCTKYVNKTCGCHQCCERMCNPKYSWRDPSRPWSCHTCRCYICGRTCVSREPTFSCYCKERSVCTSRTPTYSCECQTCTKYSLPGTGGANLISSTLSNVTNTLGDNIENGKIVIEFVK